MLRAFAFGMSFGLICAVAAQEPASPRAATRDEAQQAAAEKAKAAVIAKAQEAAALAAIRTPVPRGMERETVDPQDPIERFALLTAGGPLIIQASLTIDGEPYRIGREKLIEEMIAAADADKDGRTTWTEALSTSRFTFGRLGNLNDQFRQSIVRSLDRNKNDLVETSEARHFLAQYSQGATFSFGGGPSNLRILVAGMLQQASNAKPDVLKLLDTDLSKSLDAKELAAAAARLKRRDADDNDVLEASEITGTPAAGMYRVVSVSGPVQPPTEALLLGPTATKEAVFAALAQKYKKNARGKLSADRFSLFPQLFAALDKDQSGEIEAGEVLGLNDVAPHVELTVDLAGQKSGAGLKIASLTGEVRWAAAEKTNKILELPGVRISLAASGTGPRNRSYDSMGTALLRQFDKDGNGYLDKAELPMGFGQFDLFDENGDGKAYPDEIVAGYARQAAPQMTQVAANIVQQSNSLFEKLDANGDGRLGLREMRAAAERLAALDADQDQVIAGDEIPESFSVSFALGGGQSTPVDRPAVVYTSGPRPPASAGPAWFTRMDRNGDGDVTLKEFLGSESDFSRLDRSGDGLLDPQEARAAGK